MNILVPVKRVPDYAVKVKVKADGSSIETDGIKWIVNPFDEIAIEEAMRLQEQGKAKEVVVVGIGPSDLSQQLRYAMAMGADRGVHVVTDAALDSDAAARVLAKVYAREAAGFGMVIMGKQAIDSDASQTPQILSSLLKIPQACFASKVEVISEQKLRVTREIDGGLETVEISIPCVVSSDLRLNEPRYASLPGIMKAKKKPLEEISLADLGLADLAPKIRIRKLSLPSKRQAGKKLDSVSALLDALKNEAKVL